MHAHSHLPQPSKSDGHDRVMSAVAAAGPPAEGMTPESALADVMASRTVCNAEPANLAPFSLEKLKVCKNRIRPQPWLQFLPEHAKLLLKVGCSLAVLLGSALHESCAGSSHHQLGQLLRLSALRDSCHAMQQTGLVGSRSDRGVLLLAPDHGSWDCQPWHGQQLHHPLQSGHLDDCPVADVDHG